MSNNQGFFKTMAEIKEANRVVGNWFSRDTMGFFNCRIVSRRPIHFRFFITSERYDTEPARYTIREARADGSIGTIGEFQEYGSQESALRGLKKHYASL